MNTDSHGWEILFSEIRVHPCSSVVRILNPGFQDEFVIAA